MPAFNFQKRFAGKVESGEKRQTIRARRKDGKNPRPGDTAYLYFGMRTKSCRNLGESTITDVDTINIDWNGLCVKVVVGIEELTYRGKEALSRLDGFNNFDEMIEWFEKTHGIPFHGFLIRWGRE